MSNSNSSIIHNKGIRIALFDTDTAYTAEMDTYFRNQPETGIALVYKESTFTSGMSDQLDSLEIDAVILSIDAMDQPLSVLEELEAKGYRKIVFLFDSLNDARMDQLADQKLDMVYKYASPEQLVAVLQSLPRRYRKTRSIEEEMKETLDTSVGSVYTVYSPKGGTGKTTVAVNMALQYAQKGIKTLLIDLAMFSGAAPMLKVSVKGQGLTSIITALELDRTLLASDMLIDIIQNNIITVTLEKEGQLYMLPAASPVKMEKFGLEDTAAVIQAVRDEYDVVIIDTSSELCERNLAAFTEATKILLLTTPDIVAGWNLLQIKDFFHKLMLPQEKVQLVFNKASKYVEFDNKELAILLDYPIIAEIPDQYRQIQGYMNKGMPIAYKEWLSVNYDFKKLAHILHPVFTPKELKKPSPLRSFFVE